MPDIFHIAKHADVIVNGYAYTKADDGIHVLNLNKPEKATVFTPEGETLETTMDDIEIEIVRRYLLKNKKFIED